MSGKVFTISISETTDEMYICSVMYLSDQDQSQWMRLTRFHENSSETPNDRLGTWPPLLLPLRPSASNMEALGVDTEREEEHEEAQVQRERGEEEHTGEEL